MQDKHVLYLVKFLIFFITSILFQIIGGSYLGIIIPHQLGVALVIIWGYIVFKSFDYLYNKFIKLP